MTLNEVLQQLNGVSKAGKGYSAKCPAHDDKNASLSVSIGESGKILMYCHAGCSTKDICAAAGIKESDL